MSANAGRWRRLVNALAARPVSGDPLPEHVRALEEELDTALGQRDRAELERDRLVEGIASLIKLPPAQVARTYRVTYTGTADAATALLDLGYAQQHCATARSAGGERP